MYALYQKIQQDGVCRYVFVAAVHLFGCNQGYIPRFLRYSVPKDQSEPYEWHIDISSALTRIDEKAHHTLVINLKPKNASPNLSLYELVEVWGFSRDGWTPIMMRLRGLLIDETANAYNDRDFTRHIADIQDPIFSFLYLKGTVKAGQLVERWTTPGASPTNSVLLWPDAFKYFVKEARKVGVSLTDVSIMSVK